MKKALYTRVSTLHQKDERQKRSGYKTYSDKTSGTTPFKERKAAKRLLRDVENGKINFVRVDSIDRLGRNLIDIKQTIETLTEMGAEVFAEKENLTFGHKTSAITTLVLNLMGSIAEFERGRMLERQREGIAIAKAKGRYKGNGGKEKYTDDDLLTKHKVVVELLKKGWRPTKIAREQSIKASRDTVYRIKRAMQREGI